MTDTELILSRLDSMQGEISQMHTEMNDMHAEMNDMHTEISNLRTDMNLMHEELEDKIEAVRLSVVDVRDHMDIIEFALQTEIAKTYDLAQDNARKLSRLMVYNGKIVSMPAP